MENTKETILKGRVEEFAKEYKALFEKHGLQLAFQINFPKYKKIPRIARFGLWLIARYGAILDIKFIEKKPINLEKQD